MGDGQAAKYGFKNLTLGYYFWKSQPDFIILPRNIVIEELKLARFRVHRERVTHRINISF